MSFRLEFKQQALKDLDDFYKSGNKAIVIKVQKLLAEMLQTPFSGTGKPEQFKHSLSGFWSRRITREHRLIYEVTDDLINILSVKGHYEP